MSYQIFDYKNLLQNLPFEVNKIFDIFLNDIRLVGGSVRDLIIKKEVKDFDFVTKFLPEEIIKILQKNKIKALLTGVKFGTITAVLNDKNFEITTLRKELKNDGRHCEVKFVDDYAVDAARRDFTINALYFDYQGLVHDYFNGKSDLENKIVRFIGDAHQRIEEDFLRILRFFRFSCQYASNLDDQGFKACVAQKKNLIKLSKERIRQELIKLLCIDEKKAIINILKILNETKISDEIFAQSLHYQGLELSFILAEELNVNILTNLKLAFLFLQNDASHQFYWMDKICVTNSEKKYFYFLAEKLTKLNGVVDFLEFKKLLPFYNSKWVADLYFLVEIKNFKKENITIIKQNFEYLQKFSLPKFPLSGDDFIVLGFEKEQIGEMIKKAKITWACNDFQLIANLDKQQIN